MPVRVQDPWQPVETNQVGGRVASGGQGERVFPRSPLKNTHTTPPNEKQKSGNKTAKPIKETTSEQTRDRDTRATAPSFYSHRLKE
jgi:hypothetical protein